MAPEYSEILNPRNQEYHALDTFSPADRDAATSWTGPPDDPRVAAYDATSYLGHDVTDYLDSQGAPSLTNSPTGARHSPDLSIRNLHPNRLVTTPIKKRSDLSLRDWVWEIGASIFSLGCFAAVVGVLVANEDKSLSSWTFVFGTSLNTLIATLSTLSRAALMVPVASCISQLKWIHLIGASRPLKDAQVFEDASRGPWGSLELMWKLHIRTKLATWGSVITILTLAMGPFAQQLLSYPTRTVVSGGATFYTSHVYDSAYGQQRGTRGATGTISKLESHSICMPSLI